jgi:hypothetical protein
VPCWADNSNSTGDNPDGATDFDLFTAVVNVPAQAAGSVPDGAGGTGPLLVDRDPGGTLRLTWSPACLPAAADYAVYEGTIGDFTSHVPLVCSTSGATAATIAPGAGDRYYLVVPNDGAVEGSYGRGSESWPRPPSATACLPQALAVCP